MWPKPIVGLFLTLVLLAGCTQPEDAESPTTATPTAATSPTVDPTSASPTTPAPTAPVTPPTASSTPSEPSGPPTAPVTFRLPAAGHEEMQVRFPVFWGPQRAPPVTMTRNGSDFEATVELPVGALVRYEYGDPRLDYEHREQAFPGASANRHIVVTGPMTLDDEPYAFDRIQVPLPRKLEGRVLDASTGEPVLEAFVVADGIMAGTADGHYALDVRDRPLVVTVFTPDGSHRAITRIVEPGRADLSLEPAPVARVRLEADAAAPPGHEVRVYATAAQVTPQYFLGNQLTAEVHRTLADGALELALHEGQWVDYLYSVGNTVLSHERDATGGWAIRGFAARDGLVLRDTLGPFLDERTTWFNATVPDYTGASDVLTIGGLDPRLLVMHPAGEDRWTLAVSGRDLADHGYRYAKTWGGVGHELRNDRRVTGPQMEDVIAEWKLQDAPVAQENVSLPTVGRAFDVVVTLPDWYSHAHAFAMDPWLRSIAAEGYHGVVLNQVWSYASFEPFPVIARTAGATSALHMPAAEAVRAAGIARELGLKVEVEQQLVGAEAYLSGGKTFNETWWRAWLVEAERMNVQTARVAEAAGIDAVVLMAAQPGVLFDATFAPEYDAGMERIIARMREVYDGEIVASVDEFRVGDLDHWRSADRLTQVTYNFELDADASQEEVDARVAQLLDTRYKAQSDAAGLPMTIKLGVQSTKGALAGASVPEAQGPATESNENVLPLGLEDQRKAYSAFFRAANERPWLKEINVWVYGPTDAPQSRDVDVRAKPAGALAAAWARAITEARA